MHGPKLDFLLFAKRPWRDPCVLWVTSREPVCRCLSRLLHALTCPCASLLNRLGPRPAIVRTPGERGNAAGNSWRRFGRGLRECLRRVSLSPAVISSFTVLTMSSSFRLRRNLFFYSTEQFRNLARDPFPISMFYFYYQLSVLF